jgi:hypothetical protein
MIEPYTFTIITKENPGYFKLLESAKRWGWHLHTHFLEEPSEFSEKTYNEFIARKHLYTRDVLLRSEVTDKNFLFLDAWDTVFLGPPEELIMESELNFSAQAEIYPEKGYAPYFTEGTFPFLNAGVIWGNRLKFLRRCPDYTVLDQLGWTREYAANPAGISLDTEAKVALTLIRVIEDQSQLAYSKGRWTYLPTGTKPLIVHAAGKCGMPEYFLA